MGNKNQLEIEYWPTSKPKDYPLNSKVHTDEQIQAIANSIKEFGMNKPIGVDENGVILYGHGTRKACMRLGHKEIAVVVMSHLSPKEKIAYRVADNKIQSMTGFDMDKLSKEVDQIMTGSDINLLNIGFSDAELEELLTIDAGGILDDLDGESKEPKTTVKSHERSMSKSKPKEERLPVGLGDYWNLGENFTILVGATPKEAIELPIWAAEALIEKYEQIFKQKANRC